MSGADTILDVDLARFERGERTARRAVVDGVHRSLATGFVYVRHGMAEDLLDEAYAALAAFFHQPPDAKAALVVEGSRGQAGYTGLLVETAATSEVPDFKEMLNWGRALPEGHPLRRAHPHRYLPPTLPEAGRAALLALHDALLDVQRRFLRIVALGLGAAEGYFEGMVRDGPTLSRAIRYPPMAEAPPGGATWAAAHEDINLVTALPRATARGLQVARPGGGWIDAVAPDGHAILNAGLMLEHVANGRIAAGTHRVVAPEDERGERISLVQFCHPTPSTILAPLAASADEPLRGPPRHAGDWLDEVLWQINLVEDGRRLEGPGT